MATGGEEKKAKDAGLYTPHLLELASNLNRLRSEDSLTDITVIIGRRNQRMISGWPIILC